MIISALKITAERIADSGVRNRMMLSTPSTGSAPANIAGIMAKYLATSLATEKVVSAPRVISSCLPISTISISFVGLESRSTMLPASLAACVPVFMATPTSACASAGAGRCGRCDEYGHAGGEGGGQHGRSRLQSDEAD